MEDIGASGYVYQFKQDCPKCVRDCQSVEEWF